MRWIYSCPHCRAGLNPDETIILVGVCGRIRSLVGLHPQPGNYEIYTGADSEINQGEQWDFLCPLCHHSLATEDDTTLCALDLEVKGKRRQVVFSSIAGEKATFVVSKTGIEERHGEHAEDRIPHLEFLIRDRFMH